MGPSNERLRAFAKRIDGGSLINWYPAVARPGPIKPEILGNQATQSKLPKRTMRRCLFRIIFSCCVENLFMLILATVVSFVLSYRYPYRKL